ncbi:MAG: hypothetical protein ACOZNI_05310 [Myxococcota bacterium]
MSPPDVVVLSDGQELVGEATRLADGRVDVALADGRHLVLASDVVALVRWDHGEPERPAPADPARATYFFSPSAYTRGHGLVTLAQSELAFTTVGAGVTDFWEVQAGTFLPTVLFREARVVLAGTKVAAPVGEGLHVGAGGLAFLLPEGEEAAVVYANVTVGPPATNFTVAGGGVLPSRGGDPQGAVVLAGLHRVGPRTALVTENLLRVDGPTVEGLFLLPSAGVRLYGPAFAVDLGGFLFEQADDGWPPLVLPWLGFTYGWSLE